MDRAKRIPFGNVSCVDRFSFSPVHTDGRTDGRHTELEAANLERKVRLLILSELGFAKIGQNIPYGDIASSLQIEDTEVEKWVIDGTYRYY